MKKNKVAEIDLSKNATHIVSGGKIITLESPPSGFGKHEVQWLAGKMNAANNTETIKE